VSEPPVFHYHESHRYSWSERWGGWGRPDEFSGSAGEYRRGIGATEKRTVLMDGNIVRQKKIYHLLFSIYYIMPV
jgi:hypothetical protein